MNFKRNKIANIILSILIIIPIISSLIGCGLEKDIAYKSNMPTTKYIENGDLKVTVLNVDQGLSVLMESNGEYALYDGGPAKTSSYVVSYLQKQGVKNIKYMFASHYDADHISGLIGCVKKFKIDKFYGPDYEHDSKTYRSLMTSINDNNIPVTNPKPLTSIKLGSATIQILGPVTNQEDANNKSIIVRVVHGNESFLITGDAEKDSLNGMVSKYDDGSLMSTVYIVGHHGSHNATTKDFLELVNPQYAIISCGLNNDYGHPHKETMNLLKTDNVKIFRTDLQKEIIAISNGNKIKWNTSPSDNFKSGDELSGTVQKTTIIPISNTYNGEVVGNQKTKKFHKVNSDDLPVSSNQIVFNSYDEAVNAGYSPCKNCF